MWKQVLIGCGGAVALATAALADSSAVTTGNLNLRSGPGTGFSVVAVTPRANAIIIHGCLAGTAWCAINANGLEGWSNAGWMASATATPVISRFGVRQYGMNDLATYAYAGRAPGVATVASTRTYAATGPIRATVGTAFGTGWGWGGMRQGQYVFANVNGQDTLVDTRNSAFYLRQR